MATKLVYLENFDVVRCDASVIGITTTEDGRLDIELDQTCFYPRGGGQDWDMGVLSTADATFRVEEVRLDEVGVVHHIGQFDTGVFEAGAVVRCEVDAERRVTNTRLHSAGHVVDLAVDHIGLEWKAIRGAHYPHMSFVEYDGEATPEQCEAIRGQLQGVVDKTIADGSTNEIRFMPVAEMPAICRHVPDNIPPNKPARVVIYNGDYGIPCGGTHVRKLDEIGKVTITKLKCKKGVTKISYSVKGIN